MTTKRRLNEKAQFAIVMAAIIVLLFLLPMGLLTYNIVTAEYELIVRGRVRRVEYLMASFNVSDKTVLGFAQGGVLIRDALLPVEVGDTVAIYYGKWCKPQHKVVHLGANDRSRIDLVDYR